MRRAVLEAFDSATLVASDPLHARRVVGDAEQQAADIRLRACGVDMEPERGLSRSDHESIRVLGVSIAVFRLCRWDLRLYGEPWARQYSGDVDDSMLVEQLRALADPVRLAIVRELRGGTRCACELAQVAEVSSPLLSHHLKVLRTAELITGAKRGRWIDYTLNEAALRSVAASLNAPAGVGVPRLDCAS